MNVFAVWELYNAGSHLIGLFEDEEDARAVKEELESHAEASHVYGYGLTTEAVIGPEEAP